MTKSIVAIAALSITASSLLYSCKKDTTTSPEPTAKKPSAMGLAPASNFGSLQLYSGKFRKVTSDYKKCTAKEENCHPEDIVVSGWQLATLDNAIANGSINVRELFTNNETAVSLIPDWNTAWFADVKTAILSGGYTFVKVGTSMYLLGKAGTVSPSNYDYAISYEVQ